MLKLLFTISMLFTCCYAQIKADGKTDNADTINAMIQRGQPVILPNGNTVIKKRIVCGAVIMLEKGCLDYQFRYDLKKFQLAKYAKPLILKGSGFSKIIKAIPDTTQAAIYICGQNRDADFRASSISDVVIEGKGPGIVALCVNKLMLDNVKLIGFSDGLVANQAYYMNANNVEFVKCGRAAYIMQSHGGLFNNTLIWSCNTGFEIHSDMLVFNFYMANYCRTGLVVAGSNNTFNSCSIESNLAGAGNLIIGHDAAGTSDANIFNNLIVVNANTANIGIVWKKTAGSMELHGGGAQSCLFKVDGQPTVTQTNFKGLLPPQILQAH